MDCQLHAVPSSVRSHKRPDRVASSLKVAPLPMMNQCDAQTEDGHAMMKSDTFHSLTNLSHAVRGCHNNCRQMHTDVTTRVHASPKAGREVVS